jgi:hypothetical protein
MMGEFNQVKVMGKRTKRISVAFDSEVYERLVEMAARDNRSVANLASVLVETALFPAGRILPPREERRGGRREGAGRKAGARAVDVAIEGAYDE